MYFPLSQITTNLHTNGGEFVIKSTNTSYAGYYWKTSTDKYYTGKTPQDTPTQELISFNIEGGSQTLSTINELPINYSIYSYYNQYDTDSVNYLNLTKKSSPSLLPYYSPIIPTQQDYQTGEFRRCFCKKTNEIIYLEIDIDTYNKLVSEDPTITYQYYQPFNMPWQLTGNKEQVYTTNKNITELTMKQRKLPQFDKYLKENYIKYYK
jgi:hypothetical protein